jgi:acylpyruvate hydrolase
MHASSAQVPWMSNNADVKLATLRINGGTRAARIDGDWAVLLDSPDVGALLNDGRYREAAAAASSERVALGDCDFAPVIPNPDKILCIGLNYRSHVLEMGNQLPDYPTVFAKFRASLVGAHDNVVLPGVSENVDWEAELTMVIGRAARHVNVADAPKYIAGYTIMNDVSIRDWQRRTSQFLQGKTFESSTPLGPWMVTADDPSVAGFASRVDGAQPRADMRISCSVNGEVLQDSFISDLIFDSATIVSYLSTVITLLPGDVIATGTPGGVGAGRKPPRFLADGDEMVTAIAGIGELRNRCVKEVMA